MLDRFDDAKPLALSYGILPTRLQEFAIFFALRVAPAYKSPMRFTAAELASIDERASTLSERLSGDFVARGNGDDQALRRLSRWQYLAGGDDLQSFAPRLRSLGGEPIADTNLLTLLGPVDRAANSPRPEWGCFLNEIAQSVAESFGPAGCKQGIEHPVASGGSTVPYEHLYWRIADLAWTHVEQVHPSACSLLSVRARRGMQMYLLRRISSIASCALHSIFLAHKSIAESGTMQHFFGTAAPQDSCDISRRHYTNFVVDQGSDGLCSFFMRYPVAARLIAEVARFWSQSVEEFLTRLQNDQARLAIEFNAGNPLGRLQAIKAGVSDPHHCGRTVLILDYECGLKLVYKPRPMDIDKGFFDLVGRLNGRTPFIDMRMLRVVDQGEYGWMEYAPHLPCADARAAKGYFRRAGHLACLTHWLRAIDLHRENVVACGEHPVLVDLESLAHPLRREENMMDVQRPEWTLAGSVLRTGLLPLWQSRFHDSALYDNSGLCGPLARTSFFPANEWIRLNTDGMQLLQRRRYNFHCAHRAQLHGVTLSIRNYERDVMAGYREMAKFLESQDAVEILAERAALFDSRRRNIKRPTLVYGLLLQRSLRPEHLMAGVDRSIEFQVLPCDSGDEAVWAREIASLERLDIPYFQLIEKSNLRDSMHTEPPKLANQEEIVHLSLKRRLRLREGRIERLIAPAKRAKASITS